MFLHHQLTHILNYILCRILISFTALCCCPFAEAMDERHDLRQGKGPEYVEKLDPFVKGTSKLKYTFCYQPQQASLQKDNSHQGELPTIPYVIQDGLVAKVTTEEPESRKQSGSSSSDNWGQVLYPSQWPHRVHGHLMMRFEKEEITVGSGILVGPNHVLTAGHNLYYKGQWAKEIWFTPGRKGNYFPFGYSKGCMLLCHQQWLDPKSRKKDDYDLGMVILDRAVGNEAGWSGLLYAPDTYFDQWEITATGYPGEKGSKDYYSTEMWEGKDETQETVFTSETITYSITTSFGQSGGAIWRQWPSPTNPDQTNIFTIGIHTEGGAGGKNKGVRLTKEKFEGIINWIKTYHLRQAIDYGIPPPTLLPLTKVGGMATADEWWNHGNTFFQQDKYEAAFTCFYNAVITASDTVPDHMLLSLADCYSQGKGTPQNYLEAFNLHMQTENPRKSPKSLFLIGKCYLDGLGVPKSITSGLYFLTKAAKQKDKEAVKELYLFYSDPGKTQDLKKAEQYRKQAQTLGMPIPNLLPLEKPNPRPWKPVIETVPSNNLPDRPKNFQESFPEGSEKSYLTLLWEQLHEESQTTIISASVSGMGGVGKTYLALKYAYDALDNKAYKYIYWILSETEQSLIKGYKTICEEGELKTSFKAEDSDDKIIGHIKKSLARVGDYLLIYDNVPRIDFLEEKIPQSNGHILITSRIQEGWDHSTLRLDVFQPQDSIDYLFKAINMASQNKIERNPDNEEKASQVATELGNLPLALSHAAAYIIRKRSGETQYNFNDYYDEFRQKLIALLQPNFRYSKSKKPINHEYLILTTLKMAENLISDTANQLLTYFAYLDPDSLLKASFLSLVTDKDELDTVFEDLTIFSLIKNNGSSFSIHRLVQLVLRTEQEKEENLEKLVNLFSRMLSSFFDMYRMSFNEDRIKELKFEEFDKWYKEGSSLHSNLEIIDTHIQRLFKNEKLNAKQRLNLRVGLYTLQMLLSDPLGSLRSKILERLAWKEADQPQKILRTGNIIDDELQSREINLNPKLCKKIKKIMPFIFSLDLPNKETNKIIHLCAKIDSWKDVEFVNSFKALWTDKYLYRDLYYEIGLMVEALGKLEEPSKLPELLKDINQLMHKTEKEMSVLDKAKIISAFCKINSSRYSSFTEAIMFLYTHKTGEYEWVDIIEAFCEVNPPEPKRFANSILPLFTLKMDGSELGDVIKAFCKVDSLKLSDFVETLSPLFTLERSEYELKSLIEGLGKIGPSQLSEFIDAIQSLLNQVTTDKCGKNQLIISFFRVNPCDPKKFVNSILPLFTTKIEDDYEWGEVIEALGKVNPSQLYDFVDAIQFLLKQGIDSRYGKANFIKAFCRVNPFEPQRFADSIRSLITSEMSAYGFAKLIEAFCGAELSQLSQSISLIKSQFTSEMDEIKKAEIIKSFFVVKEAKSPPIYRLQKDIDPLSPPEKKKYSLENLINTNSKVFFGKEIEPSRLHMTIEDIFPLLADKIDIIDISMFINIFCNLEPSKPKKLAKIIVPLLSSSMLDFKYNAIIVRAFCNLNPSEPKKLAEVIARLISPEMEQKYKARIIEAFGKVNPSQPETFASYIGCLLDTVIKDRSIWEDLLDCLLVVPVEKRMDVCDKFVLFWNLYREKEDAILDEDKWLHPLIKIILDKRKPDLIKILEKVL
ncbi:NB-ARC domain-containing protein [Candidatus Paracaedibacter symbiosus]|uniref:NB-ARC domain-containing protein n=1 Tax=Candidatus Paracaedibacter symbiosus TaxID=244582 RepID=UPI000509B2B4|nr:NB-ARC domain-containing protein [Candidatus Paracaedibacter symbiosus]